MSKKLLIIGGLAALSVALIFTLNFTDNQRPTILKEDSNSIRIPTEVNERMENEKFFEESKEAYLDLIHGGDQYDWKAINADNFRKKIAQKIIDRNNKAVVSYANGALAGEWFERGSDDQAGNVRITTYDEQSDAIYAIGDGGILFKGDINGGTWQALNDQYLLDPDVLESIRLPNGTLRILAAIGNGVWYSDDEGLTWTASTGFIGSTWDGFAIDLIELTDADSTIAYLYTYKNVAGGQQNKICYSKDHGVSFIAAQTFGTFSPSLTSMCSPVNSSIAYILDNDDDVWVFEDNGVTQIADAMSLLGGSQCQIEVSVNATDTVLYILMDQNILYRSDDAGFTFNQLPDLPVTAWAVGIGTSADDVDAVYFGEMELYRSSDGGNNFTKVANWWSYYNDVVNEIHADIMHIQTYRTSLGAEFTLIPNHGGISISYDKLLTTVNVGLSELNVGQFYDVSTSPVNSSLIMGGTQDQGLQRTLLGTTTNTVSFEQVISGDYGEQQYSNNGISFWTQYPGADISYYSDAQFGYSTFGQTVPGSNLPNAGWIVPTAPAPNAGDDYILIGGGNTSGGGGSYLVKMENNSGSPLMTQFPFDFDADAGTPIAAIGTTSLDENRWYVSTENGKFYYSNDAGANWTQSNANGGPGNSWIYSADIYASKITTDLVFLGGTNYQSSPIHMSVDGGQNFTQLDNGAPFTMVHEMAMDPQENFLFAATDAGPYVYDMLQAEWFDLTGLDAPIQEYKSVEFVAADNIVRFATWGRGIWDFKIADVTGIEDEEVAIEINSVYPNPSNGVMTVNVEDYSKAKIFNLNGQEMLQLGLVPGNNKLNLSFLDAGVYVMVSMNSKGLVWKEKLVIR
jgi:photosystem II stability/assembly factor-like uncharacterized protein